MMSDLWISIGLILINVNIFIMYYNFLIQLIKINKFLINTLVSK